MGAVHEAEDLRLAPRVAVKLLHFPSAQRFGRKPRTPLP